MLNKLIDAIRADGIVDADEVVQLEKEIFADGVVDREEANALFELNDAVSGNENCSEYSDFMVRAITGHVMEDGVMDAEEVSWLAEKMQGDGKIDDVEKAILVALEAQTGTLPESLQTLLAA